MNTGKKNGGMAIRGKNPTSEDNPESDHDDLHAKRTGWDVIVLWAQTLRVKQLEEHGSG